MLQLIFLTILTLTTHLLTTHAAIQHTTTRQQCQTTTNCPADTILVSGTDRRANYTTIQAAINSLLNDNTTQTILILSGTYTEQLNITCAGPITLLGQTSSPNDPTSNSVTITWAAANHDNTGQVDNVYSSVMIVAPTLNASLTGSGPTGYPVPDGTPFGNSNFRVYNVDFSNTWAEYSDGPAHALSFSRANGGFYYCGFYSYQDTVCSPFSAVKVCFLGISLTHLLSRSTSANSETHISTKTSSPARPISCMASAQPGSNHAPFSSAAVEEASQPGKGQTQRSPISTACTLQSRLFKPSMRLWHPRSGVLVHWGDHGTRSIGLSLPILMKMGVYEIVGISIGLSLALRGMRRGLP